MVWRKDVFTDFEDFGGICKNARMRPARKVRKCARSTSSPKSARVHAHTSSSTLSSHYVAPVPALSARLKDLKITFRVTQKGSDQNHPGHAFGKSRNCNNCHLPVHRSVVLLTWAAVSHSWRIPSK